jgi:hypothetical protein
MPASPSVVRGCSFTAVAGSWRQLQRPTAVSGCDGLQSCSAVVFFFLVLEIKSFTSTGAIKGKLILAGELVRALGSKILARPGQWWQGHETGASGGKVQSRRYLESAPEEG